MVYLASSKLALTVLGNLCFALTLCAYKLITKVGDVDGRVGGGLARAWDGAARGVGWTGEMLCMGGRARRRRPRTPRLRALPPLARRFSWARFESRRWSA